MPSSGPEPQNHLSLIRFYATNVSIISFHSQSPLKAADSESKPVWSNHFKASSSLCVTTKSCSSSGSVSFSTMTIQSWHLPVFERKADSVVSWNPFQKWFSNIRTDTQEFKNQTVLTKLLIQICHSDAGLHVPLVQHPTVVLLMPEKIIFTWIYYICSEENFF